MSFVSRKVLVIGAATSIGQVVVDSFLRSGDSVLATVNVQRPASLNKENVTIAGLDLQDTDSFECFCVDVISKFGQIDIVVFLSGVLPGLTLSDYDDELMNQVMTVNFTGQAALLRRILPYLSEGSLVLMMSSISAERGSFDPIYAASKAAQIAFVKSLAIWLAPKVRFNVITPALIDDSTMFNEMDPERRTFHLKQTPTGRLTTKDDIAGVIHSLCEPAWSNVNGQVIRVNGGSYV